MPLFRRQATLFRSTALTVALALLVLQLVIFAVSAYYILLPTVRRSTDDLAALMVLSAQTWAELPPHTRPDFELELARQHNLWLLDSPPALPDYHNHTPYLQMLEQALQTRTGKEIHTKVTQFEKTWYWFEFRSGGRLISIGFPEDRLDVQSPLALTLIMLATLLLAVLTAIILARRIVKPLQELAAAARHVGTGGTPEKLPETGVHELADLARTFNTMVQQVQALLANRTTLLAGISHDLRTPLARMRIAVEMLPEDAAPRQIARLRQDIDEMNRLIGEFLAFSRGLEKEARQETDIHKLLNEIAENVRAEGASIQLHDCPHCTCAVGQMALRRIIANLLSNAVRYGNGKEVELYCQVKPENLLVSVLDRGPGIPPGESENVFRPFYRLETSRSVTTGGSGLGLAITRQLTDVNGWTIALLPREGGGTEARLSVPLS